VQVFASKICGIGKFFVCNEPQKLNKKLLGFITKHPHTNGLIMHSDQGWHYQHTRYQYLLKEHGITQSMSRKGNCLDNSVMENFFGLMKNELLYNNRWESIDDFKAALKEYIRYNNNERIKLKLKMSPVQYRTHFQNQVK